MVVDVVDEHNRPIGKAKRSDLFVYKQNFRTVHVMLAAESGNLLFQKLPASHVRSPGQLGSSVAGYLKAGESYRAAANRKVWAELRLRATLHSAGFVEMVDEGCLKYIEVFTGRASEVPKFDSREIEEIVQISPFALERLVLWKPQAFTKTFITIYGKLGPGIFKRIGEEGAPS